MGESEIAESTVSLEILAGSRRGELITLAVPGFHRLGCAEDCEVVFSANSEPFVSRHHAALQFYESEAFITDLGSSNGTFLNRLLVSDQPQRIFSGDVFELGGEEGPHLRLAGSAQRYVRPFDPNRATTILRRPVPAPAPAGSPPATSRLRRWRSSAPVLLAALLVLGLYLYLDHQRQQEAASLIVLRDELGRAQTELATAQRELNDSRDELAVAAREAATHAGESVGRRLAEQYGPAIFLIALRVTKPGFSPGDREIPAGHLLPMGTAWACDRRGWLATNGHVLAYLGQIRGNHPESLEPVVVQNGTGKVFQIVDSRLHPDFALEARPSPERLTCDVAWVDLGEPLAAVIPLATRQQCQELAPGESVFSIGFPINAGGGLQSIYGYDQPERVIATIRHGWVQRITDADGRLARPAERRLVHLDMAALGGQSGSPVFTESGQVVAILNATAVFRLSAGGHSGPLPHPGLLTYSVRADALLDLLDSLAGNSSKSPPPPNPAP